MNVYLMQHGRAYSEAEDPQRGLNPEGVGQVKAAGRAMRLLGLNFDLIAASPKRRAQQTAALVAEAVRYPYSDILTSEALLPKADPAALREILESETDAARVLVVGHLPHLASVARDLAKSELAFENAGLAGLEFSADGGRVQFLLTSRQLERLAG